MKILNLIRHAEAENHFYGENDFSRELTLSGVSDIVFLDEYLIQYNFKNHKILCSAAKRAKETCYKLRNSLNPDSSVVVTNDLYLATFKNLLKNISYELQNTYMLTVIGHNPGISDLLSYIIGNYDIPDMPTSSFASIYFDKNIKRKLNEGEGKLEELLHSKNSKIIHL